ncbi:TIM barrel protein [Candidatus Bathyarchaeota archaeon A05DMB-2]|jgi:deoxyribonuclease-4|nr:TIM barrel protein [Candidatus Bathyarchaeota archaeon A05DMB-2]
MADRPRFGPAGVPPLFRILGAQVPDVPKLLHEEGLDAFEYQAVRWGQKPQMKQKDAENLGAEAVKNDVLLSMHGSYYVNLSGKKEIVEASKRRVVACATAAQWMGAYVVVFHMGFYGRVEKNYAFKNCVNALKEIVETLDSLGIRNVKLGPETMGRIYQVGTLEEVLTICEEVEQTQLVLDWSHMHARYLGKFRKVEDFRAVVEEVERRLGAEAARNMHCHFSKIEYTDKGERRHHTLDEARYGPNFEMLAEVIADFKMRPVMICETPILDVDAVKMRDILRKVMEKQKPI